MPTRNKIIKKEKAQCKGIIKYNGKQCTMKAVINGYCINHYKIYVINKEEPTHKEHIGVKNEM